MTSGARAGAEALKATDVLFEHLEKFESSLHALFIAGALDEQPTDSAKAREAKRFARELFG